MVLQLVMPHVGSCLPADLAGGGGAGDVMPISITKPVGQGPLARNLPEDVRTIQDALNQVTQKGIAGGPVPLLVVDGLIGPKTNAAILKFQREQVKTINPDGLVEPGKQTILKLNELVAPISRADLNAKLAKALPIAKAALAAAIANLRAVISQGPAPGPSAIAADRLNRHFALNKLNAAAQSDARVTLFETYSEMALVINEPTLFDIFGTNDAFDVDKANAKIALTTSQGVFEPAQDENGDPNKARRIRLGLGFFAPNVTANFAAHIIVHELTHFTGRRDGQRIVDNGRGWFDDVFIKPLSPAARLTNADSYASFAEECRSNSSAKPPFVKTAPGGLGGAR
ncbi:hypothetical protein sos41_28670 [Alphaproteobacteria bacterium SO-S41]|nr:hypothetical protein sos41_28670 [Alphaproteobacteria bacterium SO-S41]